jgi:hypothetical protein
VALSTATPISANDIFTVRRLAPGHPVYLLTGANLSKLVVKQEMTTGLAAGRKEALRTNAELMHAVDTDANVVVLTGNEVLELTAFVNHDALVAAATNTAVSADVQNLTAALGGGGKWVKMGVKRLRKLDDAGNDRVNHGNKAGVRAFAAALNAPGGLEKFGEVLAVDLFNDNNDRFALTGAGAFNGTALHFLINLGNVLLSSGQVSGLDSWDPNSGIKDTRAQLAIQDPNGEWGGHLLSPAGQVTVNGQLITRDAFAAGVIADLETVLGPRNRSLPGLRTQRLAANAKARLLAGLTTAGPKIRAKLRQVAGPGALLANLPVLLGDKATALGWVPL